MCPLLRQLPWMSGWNNVIGFAILELADEVYITQTMWWMKQFPKTNLDALKEKGDNIGYHTAIFQSFTLLTK